MEYRRGADDHGLCALTTGLAQIEEIIETRKTKKETFSRICFVKQWEKLPEYLHPIADFPTGAALAHRISAKKSKKSKKSKRGCQSAASCSKRS